MTYDVVVIGGGPAGLAASVAAFDNGAKNILVLERDTRLGGILLQCIHNGFGLHYFGEELTGPEYAGRFVNQLKERSIEYKTDTMVLAIDANRAIDENKTDGIHTVTAINTHDGLMVISTKTIILAMGCRERTRGALVIPGTRPAGIFTAGSAQRFVNIDGYLPGKKVVILGSGDIGLIMARRLTLEGCEVKLVCEIMSYSAGLSRNMTQCVENFNIPVRFDTTIVEIHGNERVEGVTIASVDDHRNPIKGTEQFIECDTLLLSVGLIPENEISVEAHVRIDPVTKGPSVNQFMETSVPGIFACGNTVHVHDLVDFVTRESTRAGLAAADYVKAQSSGKVDSVPVRAGNRVRYTVPQHIDVGESIKARVAAATAKDEKPKTTIMFRSTDVYRNVTVHVYSGTHSIYEKRSRIVRPGEMQTVELDTALLQDTRDSLTVSIELPEDMID